MTPKQKHLRDEIVWHVPIMLFRVLLIALVFAVMATLLFTQFRVIWVWAQPASRWFVVNEVTIPTLKPGDMEETRADTPLIRFKRTVLSKEALSIGYQSEIHRIGTDQSMDLCPNSGRTLYHASQNDTYLYFEPRQWIGACKLPDGCYRQSISWVFLIHGHTKQVDYETPVFEVASSQATGCREEQNAQN